MTSYVERVFPIRIKIDSEKERLRRAPGHDNVVICELEPILAVQSPPTTGVSDNAQPQKPAKLINYVYSTDEWKKSTTRTTRLLHALQSSPDIRSTNSEGLIGAVNEIRAQLLSSKTVEDLFSTIIGTVSKLTGFDRVMVYRFSECKCGAVVAEYVNPVISEDLFIGLHFPSPDLPVRTRNLYKADRVQILRNGSGGKSSLRFRDASDTELDLTGAYLRDCTPDQVQFLSDLNVSSIMITSLVVEGDLSGLITHHSYGSRTTEIALPLREICRNIGQCVSSQVEQLLDSERLEARLLLATGLSQKSPAAFITDSASTLLEIFASEFSMLIMNDEVRPVGKLVSYDEALALVHADFPDLHYALGFPHIAEPLAIPLSTSGADFLIMGGVCDEYEQSVTFCYHVRSRCHVNGVYLALEASSMFLVERYPNQVMILEHELNTNSNIGKLYDYIVETASMISTLYGTFTEIWRKKQAYLEKSRMRQLLISNASHDDGNMEKGVHEHVKESLTASKSLIYVISDLLNLTKGDESSDSIHEQIPTTGTGDPQRLRQTLSNILSSALAHSNHGAIRIEVHGEKIVNSTDLGILIHISITDEGQGMSEEQLDTLFHQFENILDRSNGIQADTSNNSGNIQNIGLRLAVVARFVYSCNGELRIRTKQGAGTQIRISLSMGIEAPEMTKSEPLLTPPTETAIMGSVVCGQNTPESTVRVNLGTPLDQPEGSSSTLKDAYLFPTSIILTVLIDKIKLQILVAEDNPLNAKILKLRLLNLGHDVVVVGDRQICFDTFRASRGPFDVILMDLQSYGSVPIFAVSTSLEESKRDDYILRGFNEWVLKPIDFRRLGLLMSSIWDQGARSSCAYKPEMWESGGWFEKKGLKRGSKTL
ncbi:hypothetical protein G7Y89_g1267 [Cudoniella acicularis]|uniref:Uncharacterized protein n=1 Tax=Cudoniella acicularis TaxID=354080 RepID=A0A8H4RYI1_9HELO|nr:hypothetical protein G7Y89_g1267 [Cudoniella acicularis]